MAENSIPTRFKKGKSGNPAGRRKKPPVEHDPGSIIEAIDNEEIEVKFKGKRQRMKMVELEFRQLFNKAIHGNLSALRMIAHLAAVHHAPGVEDNVEAKFIGVTEAKRRFGPNYLQVIAKLNEPGGYQINNDSTASRKPKKQKSSKTRHPSPNATMVSTTFVFRKIANELVSTNVRGKTVKMTQWEACVRAIQALALNNERGASQLLSNMRETFPGKITPARQLIWVGTDADMKL